MISVDQLKKSYDGIAYALKGVSFEVAKGEVVGFLGPNGAGKSTTMKILTGFLLPTEGRATIDGLDVVRDSLQVRRRIGYLPESTPLYYEMRVDDYLRFTGRIRGVPGKELTSALSRVIDLCGLDRVTGKNILELSKGYKQRVGLAQAMIHRPKLLILDEPTSGLDPNQIVEVRKLIKQLGEDHTVMVSTHILQEVEASCSRILIISLGKLVADGSLADLLGDLPGGDVHLRVRGPSESVLSQLRELLGESVPAEIVSQDGDVSVYRVSVNETTVAVEEGIAHLIVKNDWALLGIWREKGTLEQVFHSKTLHEQVEAGDA
jgi:ABC-2 type transport system ATP-binding protein